MYLIWVGMKSWFFCLFLPLLRQSEEAAEAVSQVVVGVVDVLFDGVDGDASYPRAYNVLHSANALLNVGLNIAGNAAAIYNLATGTVKNKASSTIVPGGLN